MKYVIDTCSLLEGSLGRNYEKEFFPIHWKNFDDKIDEELIVSTSLVYHEIKEQDDYIFKWADNKKYLFKPPLEEVQEELINLLGLFPKWAKYNNRKKYTWADPELIAYAKANSLILVTQEQYGEPKKEEKYKIPRICLDFEVECIDFLELIKRENLHIDTTKSP